MTRTTVFLGLLDPAPDGEPRYCWVDIPEGQLHLITPKLAHDILEHHRNLDRQRARATLPTQSAHGAAGPSAVASRGAE